MATLRQYLRQQQLTQEAFSRLTGIPQSLISRFCTGRAEPTLQRAAEIERATEGAVPMSAWVQSPGCASEGRAPDAAHPSTAEAPARARSDETVNPEGGA